MAGDWIKMRVSLLTSPKVVRMASALKADRFRIVGGLLSVWCLFDSHSEDGKLSGYTLEALDDLAAWDGFSGAMVAVGWLENDGDELSLPRFDAHNGASSKRRAQDQERKRGVRKTSASNADKTRTREEKRREEKSKELNPLSPPEGEGAGAPPSKDSDEDNGAGKTKRATRLPEDWTLPEEWLDEGLRIRPEFTQQQMLATADEFRDYWIGKSGKDATKTDWLATWRNWVRRQRAPVVTRSPSVQGKTYPFIPQKGYVLQPHEFWHPMMTDTVLSVHTHHPSTLKLRTAEGESC